MFVAARIAYTMCYVADWHWARTVVWTLGFVVTLTIFVAGL
jgi:uncharacterized MAPEG superfamily protein